MEYFLDVLREGYIVFRDIFQGNYTVIEATGSRTRINVEAYTQLLQDIFKTYFAKLYIAFCHKLVGLLHNYRATQQGLEYTEDLAFRVVTYINILYKGINTVNEAIYVSIDKVLSVYYNSQVVGVFIQKVELTDFLALDFDRIRLTISSTTSIIGSFVVVAVFVGVSVVITRKRARVAERVR